MSFLKRQKQIILTSDRPANNIEQMESRIASRFKWGLMADINAPDYETRLAIIKSKAEGMSLKLSEEICEFLAKQIVNNVRHIEGAINCIAGYKRLLAKEMTLEMVEQLTCDILQEDTLNSLTISRIQDEVSQWYKISKKDLLSPKRTADIAFARQVAMYLCRNLTKDSLSVIGEQFGNRKHGTVIHAHRLVEDMIEQDKQVAKMIQKIKKSLIL